MQITPRVIDRFPFEAHVARILRTKNIERSDLVAVVTEIFNAFLKGKTFPVAFEQFLDIACTIDAVKVRTTGRQATTETSNLLIVMLGGTYGNAGSIRRKGSRGHKECRGKTKRRG